MNKALEKYSKEELIDLISVYCKEWLAMDGLWFQAVERHDGMDKAMEMDVEVWNTFTVLEAKRIKGILGLEDNSGLEGLEAAMRMRLYANINEEEYIIEGKTLTYRTVTCRVQDARSRKNMEWHPCKSVGEVEYAKFAQVIDSRIKCQCLSCYPEKTDDTCACSWKFTLED